MSNEVTTQETVVEDQGLSEATAVAQEEPADKQAEAGSAKQTEASAEEQPKEAEQKPDESAGDKVTETETEPDESQDKAHEADIAAKLADAELRAAAALAGIPAERIPYAVRMADASKVVDAKSAGEQIAAIVKDVPELKQQPQATGSAGNFPRKTAETKVPFLQGLQG